MENVNWSTNDEKRKYSKLDGNTNWSMNNEKHKCFATSILQTWMERTKWMKLDAKRKCFATSILQTWMENKYLNEILFFVTFVVKIEMNEIWCKEQMMQNMYLSMNNAKHKCFTTNTMKTNVWSMSMKWMKRKRKKNGSQPLSLECQSNDLTFRLAFPFMLNVCSLLWCSACICLHTMNEMFVTLEVYANSSTNSLTIDWPIHSQSISLKFNIAHMLQDSRY